MINVGGIRLPSALCFVHAYSSALLFPMSSNARATGAPSLMPASILSSANLGPAVDRGSRRSGALSRLEFSGPADHRTSRRRSILHFPSLYPSTGNARQHFTTGPYLLFFPISLHRLLSIAEIAGLDFDCTHGGEDLLGVNSSGERIKTDSAVSTVSTFRHDDSQLDTTFSPTKQRVSFAQVIGRRLLSTYPPLSEGSQAPSTISAIHSLMERR